MAKELIKYPFVEKIDVVETDKMFVDVCRNFPGGGMWIRGSQNFNVL